MFHFEITNDLTNCINETKIQKNTQPGIDIKSMKLVYYEKAGNIIHAISLKKKFVKWDNFWIKMLIEKCNPGWNDLSEELMLCL